MKQSAPLTKRQFRKIVRTFYAQHGRHTLPWRKTTKPYCILISELMLQQTQVDRVVPKYRSFIKHFPTVHILARAPLKAVLLEWQGLGYNRRAKLLHQTAKIIVDEYSGRLPKTRAALERLPGIGPYTAGAIRAFAFNLPDVFIETNIRTVFLHHFFHEKHNVSDTSIKEQVQVTLDIKNPRDWYAALMDYGAHLKQTLGNLNQQSAHYSKQSVFAGSDRSIRGKLLKLVLTRGTLSVTDLVNQLPENDQRIKKQLKALQAENLLMINNNVVTIAD